MIVSLRRLCGRMLMVFCTLATIEQQDEDKLGIQNSFSKEYLARFSTWKLRNTKSSKVIVAPGYIYFTAVNYLEI
jgi:hypothetical protein